MTIKAIQWNIGGGKLLKQGADPTLIASYSVDGINEIADFIKTHSPDIVTLQEVQSNKTYNQAKLLAEKTGLQYWFYDTASESHKDKGNRLGMAILTRFPGSNHSFKLFFNPKYEHIWEDGSIATSYDKGITTATLHISTKLTLDVQTLHLIPFRRFGIDALSDSAKEHRKDVASKIGTGYEPFLIQGDFNFDDESLMDFLPIIFKSGLQEVKQQKATTPKGRKYDHVLYKGLVLKSSGTEANVLTDHYPIITEFEVP